VIINVKEGETTEEFVARARRMGSPTTSIPPPPGWNELMDKKEEEEEQTDGDS
jgi:hypothetical protein